MRRVEGPIVALGLGAPWRRATTQRPFKRFVTIWLAAAAALAAGGLALNIRYDSSGVLAALSLKRVKPTAADLWMAAVGLYPMPAGNREAKALNSIWYKPQVAALGSSNVWSYVDPRLASLRQPDGRFAYNFGLPGVSMFEIAAGFRHLVALGNLRRGVVGLEFFMFAGNRPFPGPLDTMPLAYQRQYRDKMFSYVSRHLLSMGALQKSLPAALKNIIPAALAAEAAPPQALDDERLRGMIHRADREQTTALYRPDLPFLFTDSEGHSTFDALRAVIALAYREGITLNLYLTPHHARAYELIRAIGLWPKYRAWLRELAAIADTSGACIIDFGSYSGLTTNTEAATGPSAVFRTHPDSIHMGPELATQIIDSLGAIPCSSRLDGGTPLTGRTIDGYLAAIEARRERVAQANPAFVEDVTALARTLPHRPDVLNSAYP
jgi:hypothetical protein